MTYSDWQRNLCAHLLKSLVKILGISVSSYSCSVWEAGPFSLSLFLLFISLSVLLLILNIQWPFTSWQCFTCDSHLSHLSRNEAVPGAVERADTSGMMSKPPPLNFLPCDWCDVYIRSSFREVSNKTQLVEVPMIQSCCGLCSV